MEDINRPRCIRGPYRLKKRTPRQTKYNRKIKTLGPRITRDDESEDRSSQQTPHDVDVGPSSPPDDRAGEDQPHLGSCQVHFSQQVTSTRPMTVPQSDKLFQDAAVTQVSSEVSINSYISRHHLTRQAQEDLLRLLQLHMPPQSCLSVPSTVYTLKKYSLTNSITAEKTLHYMCPHCWSTLPPALSSQDGKLCPNAECGTSLDDEALPYFLTIGIAEQLQLILKRQGVYKSILTYKEQRRVHGYQTDLRDGSMYRELMESNQRPLSLDGSISVTMNTDGISVFKSKNTSVWPVLMMINELPFVDRKLPKNMVLAGIWCSQKKPPMQHFQPIIEELLLLEDVGLELDIEDIDEQQRVAVHCVCVSCDLPAKALVQNFIQFNGIYGCGFCEQPGEVIGTDKGGNVTTFPFIIDDPKGPRRTPEKCIRNAQLAIDTKSVVMGVKGPSSLSCLRSLNFIDGFSIDYMHCVLLGVTKLLMKLWFEPSCSRGTLHDLHRNIPMLNNQLREIKVPSMIRRKPRGLDEIKHWKAAEYRSWLLYYSIPLLRGVLDVCYFEHYILFAEAIWLLLQAVPTTMDIDKAEKLLHHFCLKFPSYYAQRNCTANVHLLVHLADCVRCLGPLWAHSAFPFEDTNGWLADQFRGTRDPEKQIVKGFTEWQALTVLAEGISSNDDETEEVKAFFDQMLQTGQRYAINGKLEEGVLVIGKQNDPLLQVTTEEVAVLDTCPNAQLARKQSVRIHKRLLIHGVLFSSLSYTRQLSTCDYVMKFSDGRIGFVTKYLSTCLTSCSTCSSPCTHLVIAQVFPVTPQCLISDDLSGASAGYIHYFNDSRFGELKVYTLNNIHSKCVYLNSIESVLSCAVEVPNLYERNL